MDSNLLSHTNILYAMWIIYKRGEKREKEREKKHFHVTIAKPNETQNVPGLLHETI